MVNDQSEQKFCVTSKRKEKFTAESIRIYNEFRYYDQIDLLNKPVVDQQLVLITNQEDGIAYLDAGFFPKKELT